MILEELEKIIKKRKREQPDNSYVVSLFNQGEDRIIQKVGEEAVELVIDAKNNNKKRIIEESADLLFHLIIMLQEKGVNLSDIYKELEHRKK